VPIGEENERLKVALRREIRKPKHPAKLIARMMMITCLIHIIFSIEANFLSMSIGTLAYWLIGTFSLWNIG